MDNTLIIKCSKCNLLEFVDNFLNDRRNRTGKMSYCKSCQNEYKGQKIKCELCNCMMRRDSYTRHIKSLKHREMMKRTDQKNF